MILTHLFESLNEQRLNVGDPIIVTGPNEFEGKTGEIAEFSPSGKFVVVNLYNHGEHSMHLSDVEYNQYAADQEDEDDWYDDGAEDTLEGATTHAKQIHDLNFDMLALLDAAKTASPEQKVILKQKFQIAKQKRNELLGGTLADSPVGKLGEGFQDFNKVEPYAVCLAGKPVKKFDYYEDARRFHDNWKKKLYREGNQAKADKITLLPLNLDEEQQKPADPNEFRPVGPITIVPPKKLKSGETYQDRNKYWQSQGQAPIYKTNEEGKGTPVPAKEFARGVLKDLKKVNVKEAEGDFRAVIRKVMSKVHVDGGGGNLSYMISQRAPTMDMLRDVYHDDIERMLAKAHPNELKKAAEELKAMFKKDVAEAETDYQKRRQRERDVDAGKPVAKQRYPKQTDYQKKRAQDKKDMELGEGSYNTYNIEDKPCPKCREKELTYMQGTNHIKCGACGKSFSLAGKKVDEAKGLAKRVKIVAGSEAGKTGTIGEVRTGAFAGAPKTYTVDIDGGGHIQLPAKALRLLRDQTLDEVGKETLGRYVKLAGIDTANRASASSYKSGVAGDAYNKADPSRQEQNRERGIDRAVTRLTK